MVKINFGIENPYKVYIVRNWRDHIDQLIISSLFTIGLLTIAIYLNTIHDNSRIYYYVWPMIGLIVLIFYIFPNSITTFDLENNLWKVQYYAIFPIKKIEGTISSLTNIVSTENVDDRRKSKFSLKKSKYYSDLSILKSNNENEPEKTIMYSFKTFSYQSHKYNVKQNEKIGYVLEEFFQNLNISIEYEKSFDHFTNVNI